MVFRTYFKLKRGYATKHTKDYAKALINCIRLGDTNLKTTSGEYNSYLGKCNSYLLEAFKKFAYCSSGVSINFDKLLAAEKALWLGLKS